MLAAQAIVENMALRLRISVFYPIVPKQGYRVVGSLFQITEAYDIAKGFDAIISFNGTLWTASPTMATMGYIGLLSILQDCFVCIQQSCGIHPDF